MKEPPAGPVDPAATEISWSESAAPADGGGQQIGPYRLLQRIGEGGMGEVWLVEQSVPVRRRVALKIIKQGMDTKQVVARFEAERQALAMMDHPLVAKVFDAGATPEGRPYFVMEYVRGVPITEHCERHKLTTGERLRLFMQVCDGVQHAHHKALIHRDLKPTNVLVSIQDGKALPKIIDFGIAKATAQRLTERTVFTELGILIGTPEYMSPEQADLTGQDLDTRTDVYSLGVILYELLVGALPFEPRELRSAGLDGIRRMIREVEPPRPSTRLSTLEGERSTESARQRRVDVPTLRRELRGDLDWITMKALEKDRTRRYGSPAELAADVVRHLLHEPVLAASPTAAYRARKFVRRHRGGVLAACLVLLALLLGAAGATLGLIRATRSEAKAKQEAAIAREVSQFVVGLFAVSDPREARGGAITAREILDKGAADIEQQLAGQPEIQAHMMDTIGTVYRRLGLYAEAEVLLDKALANRRQLLGEEDPLTITSLNSLAILYVDQGRYDLAEPLYLECVESGTRVLGADDDTILTCTLNLADLYAIQGHYEKALPLQIKTLEARRRLFGEEHEETMTCVNALAVTYIDQGKYKEAEPLYVRLLEIQHRVLGNDHPYTLGSMNSLAKLYADQGHLEKAEPLYVEALHGMRRILGEDHPDTILITGNLGDLYTKMGRYDDALESSGAAVERARRAFPEAHWITGLSLMKLGVCLIAMGRYQEAEEALLEAHEELGATLGPEHARTERVRQNLVRLYEAWGQAERAARWRAN